MSVPPEAITAAAEAMRKAACTLPQVEFGTPLTTLAKAALEAAAPLIADAQRDADAQLAEKHRAIVIERGTWAHGQPFADLLRAGP